MIACVNPSVLFVADGDEGLNGEQFFDSKGHGYKLSHILVKGFD